MMAVPSGRLSPVTYRYLKTLRDQGKPGYVFNARPRMYESCGLVEATLGGSYRITQHGLARLEEERRLREQEGRL